MRFHRPSWFHHVGAIGVSVLALGFAAACGSSGGSSGGSTSTPSASPVSTSPVSTSTTASPVSITIGSANFGENVILAHLYEGVLKKAGVKVTVKEKLGSREVIGPAIESGQIDLVPEYAGNLLGFVDKSAEGGLPVTDTVTKLKAALESKGLTVLEASSAVDGDVLVANKETAAKFNLVTISDLAAHGSELVLGGPPECPTRVTCQAGLTSVYAITFKSFKALDAGGPLTVTALTGNDVQIGRMFSADSTIKAKGFVILTDDKHFQQAGNVIPEIRKDKATPEVIAALNLLSKTLTTEDLIALDDKVSVDKQDPATVAAAYLTSKGLA